MTLKPTLKKFGVDTNVFYSVHCTKWNKIIGHVPLKIFTVSNWPCWPRTLRAGASGRQQEERRRWWWLPFCAAASRAELAASSGSKRASLKNANFPFSLWHWNKLAANEAYEISQTLWMYFCLTHWTCMIVRQLLAMSYLWEMPSLDLSKITHLRSTFF